MKCLKDLIPSINKLEKNGKDDHIYSVEDFDAKYEIQKLIDKYEEEYE